MVMKVVSRTTILTENSEDELHTYSLIRLVKLNNHEFKNKQISL